MEVPTRSHPKDLDVPEVTFTRPDLTTFTGLDDLGLEVTGQPLEPHRAVLAGAPVQAERMGLQTVFWCSTCQPAPPLDHRS